MIYRITVKNRLTGEEGFLDYDTSKCFMKYIDIWGLAARIRTICSVPAEVTVSTVEE